MVNEQVGYVPSIYSGYIGYSLEGAAPNRQLFVRWFNVEYYAAESFVIPGTATFDVVLSENSSVIETRYYSIASNPSSLDTLVVGVHGQNESAYTAVQNAPMLTKDIAARLSYSTVTYSYNGPAEAATCGAGVYPQLASIPDLNITVSTSRYWLKPCGVTSTSACSTAGGLATQASSVCLSRAGTISSLATDNPTATQWIVTSSTSVRSVTQDAAWSFTCGAPPTVIVDYVCSAAASDAVLSSAATTGCTYNFVVNTNLLCSAAPPTSFSSSSSSASAASAASSSAAATSASSTAVIRGSSSSSIASTTSSSAVVLPSSSTSASATPPSLVTSSPISATLSSSSGAAGAAGLANSSGSGLSGGAIAGIVIGSLAGVLLLCLLLAFVVLRGGKKNERYTSSNESSQIGGPSRGPDSAIDIQSNEVELQTSEEGDS